MAEAAPNPFAPILLFNKQKAFDACYSLDTSQQILDFFQEIADKLEAYGVPEARRADVTMLVDKIKGLSNGVLFSRPRPPCQILRISAGGKVVLNPTSEVPWSGNLNRECFYIIYDLIGALLSLTSTISETSDPPPTPTNYFLPLLTLYGKWCRILTRVGLSPTVVQVTWFADDGKILHPFFGASIGALPGDKDLKDKIRQKRWDYLFHSAMLPADFSASDSFNDSLNLRLDVKGGTRYGHCAETYPFLYILKAQNEATKLKSHGIAFDLTKVFTYDKSIDVTSNLKLHPKYDGQLIWTGDAMLPPCLNCKTLLKASGLDWKAGTEIKLESKGLVLPGKYDNFQLHHPY